MGITAVASTSCFLKFSKVCHTLKKHATSDRAIFFHHASFKSTSRKVRGHLSKLVLNLQLNDTYLYIGENFRCIITPLGSSRVFAHANSVFSFEYLIEKPEEASMFSVEVAWPL